MPEPTHGSRARRGRLVVGAGTLLAVAALIAGCSSSGNSAAGGSGGGSSVTTVNVFTTTPSGVPYFALNHGNDLGAWDGTNIKVNVIKGTASTSVATLAAGKADISIGSAVTTAAAIQQGLPAKIVGATTLPWDQNLVVSKASGITTAQGLKGHTFGVSSFSSAGYYATTKMAESFGWSKSDYKVTQLTTIDALSAALKSGTIQAFYWNPQQVAQLAEQGVGVNLGPGAQYVGQTINSAFTVTDSALKDKAAAVKVFLTGYYNLVKKLQADPTPVLNTLVNDEKANKAATESVYKASVAGWSATGDMPEANKQGLSAAVVFLTPKVKSVDIAKICIDWHTL